MLAVLRPRSINDAKFSTWCTTLEVLGLQFNTIAKTVTMPKEKLAKASTRVVAMQRKSTVSRHDLECLLGSLRHVTCLLRAAKAFFQRIHTAVKGLPRRGRFPLSDAIRLDLQWFHFILNYDAWSGIPTSMFCSDPPIDVHWYMDASDRGLAVADPARQRYILLQFDADECTMIHAGQGSQPFNINVRELFCVALASVLWGRGRSVHGSSELLHVKAWSDNTNAVTWTNRLHSDNVYAQELLRAIGLCEATQHFRVTAGHLPGECNTLADAGSRQHNGRLASRLQARALADSSYRVYKATWKEWCRWCDEQGFSSWLSGDCKRDSNQLIQFVVYCWQHPSGGQRNAASTILSKIGHLSWFHRRFKGYSIGLHEGHRLAMRGMSRLSPPPDRKEPITVGLLRCLRSQCNFDNIHDRVLWGAAAMGYFFMLRRSEYMADRGQVKNYAIQYRDVSFTSRNGQIATSLAMAVSVSINFRGGKADQRGVGATRTLEKTGLSWLWPVRACWALTSIAKQRGAHQMTYFARFTGVRR
ncbi:hypothetical protein PHMEG_00010769, partial [Phytophthora megakarya]